MAKDSSFDISAEIDVNEIDNAFQQAIKEIGQRWDFKGKTAELEWKKGDKLVVYTASDNTVFEAMREIFHTKVAKRGVSIKALEWQKEEPAAGAGIRVTYGIIEGLPQEKAKQITKMIKKAKFKVQASIQGDSIRVTSKSRDELQAVQKAVEEMELQLPISYGNYK